MITHEDIDRIKYPEIGDRVIEDCTWMESISRFTIHKVAELFTHVLDSSLSVMLYVESVIGIVFLGIMFDLINVR